MSFREHKHYKQYEGNWKGNAMSGKGVMIYANGDVYDGHWKNYKKCGEGKMSYSKHKRYKEYDGK